MLLFLVFLFALPFSHFHLRICFFSLFLLLFFRSKIASFGLLRRHFASTAIQGCFPSRSILSEREQNSESKRAREAGRQREREREQERESAHASNFLCLRTVPETIWVSFESKLTYALDQNRSMQPANAPHQQGPCRNQEQRKTQSQRGNQWKSHKTNKESWQSKIKLSGVRYKQILKVLGFLYVVLTVLKVLAGVICEYFK